VIEARHLSKRFGGCAAVDDVSLRIARGEVVGFLGPNGAGKTTTLRMLAGVFPPTGGQALIDGRDLATAPRDARRLVGYAPEHPALHGDMTVRSELDYVAAMRDVPAGAVEQRAEPASAVAHDQAITGRGDVGEIHVVRDDRVHGGDRRRELFRDHVRAGVDGGESARCGLMDSDAHERVLPGELERGARKNVLVDGASGNRHFAHDYRH